MSITALILIQLVKGLRFLIQSFIFFFPTDVKAIFTAYKRPRPPAASPLFFTLILMPSSLFGNKVIDENLKCLSGRALWRRLCDRFAFSVHMRQDLALEKPE